jgi:hypothetical protein
MNQMENSNAQAQQQQHKTNIRFKFKWIILSLSAVFLLILLGNYFLPISPSDSSEERAIKTNMHQFQNLVESFAAKEGGYYPANVSRLRQTAQAAEYWQELTNPIIGSTGEGYAYANLGASARPGLLVYQAFGSPPQSYRIQAYAPDGKKFLSEKRSCFWAFQAPKPYSLEGSRE